MRTLEFIHEVKQTIDEYRGQSMRSIAKKLHVSEKTIKRNVHEDIRFKSCVMKGGQFISKKSKRKPLKQIQKTFKQTQKSC